MVGSGWKCQDHLAIMGNCTSNSVRNFRRTSLVIACSALLCSCCLVPDKNPNPTTFEEYLYQAGDKAHCFFTIERTPFDSLTPWSYMDFQGTPCPESVDGIIKILRKKLKGVQIIRSTEDPVVIHVIDASLQQIDHYVMERRTSIHFTGIAYELPTVVGRNLNYEMYAGSRGSNLYAFNDYTTRLDVDAQDQQVRWILTMSLPLSSYRRILWIAWTSRTANNFQTLVQYTGQMP